MNKETGQMSDISTVPMQPASIDIWDKKYRLKTKLGANVDADINATYERIARTLADLEATPELREQWYGEFLWALKNGAIPAGRITSNAGALEHKPATSTINCTVSDTIQDSMIGILESVKNAGLTLRAGSGIGYCMSTMRPKGAFVAGAGAHTSGPMSFMDIFDKMCFTIASAGGRRGAQMATFDVGHPDVRDFIRAKREDGRLRQFNLSLLITDDFINAVKNDGDWTLTFPLRQKEAEGVDLNDPAQVVWKDWETTDGYIVREDGKVAHKVYDHVKARNLWDMIMSSTYDYAEPGFILIDKVNEMNNNWFCENIRATNPCVPADMWVQTADGPRQVRQLIGTQFLARVDGRDHLTGPEGFFRTATKRTVTVKTAEGYSLRLTEDHRVRRIKAETRWNTETEWCEAGELRKGDSILLNDHRSNSRWDGPLTHEQGYLLGMLVGDGTLKRETAVLSAWEPAMVANGSTSGACGVHGVMAEVLRCAETMKHRSDFAGWSRVAGRNESSLQLAPLRDLAFSLGMDAGNKRIAPALEQASSDGYRGFLRGFFDADGSVQGTHKNGISIRLAQSDSDRLEAVQRMLLRLGIPSTIYFNRRHATTKMMPDGKGRMREYAIKAQHELVIRGQSIARFDELIGFADTDKSARLKSLLAAYKKESTPPRFAATVTEIVPGNAEEDVFDVTVPGVNTFDGNGAHCHNCGEQSLPPHGACLLGSVNLTKFVKSPFTEHAEFDWTEYRKVVKVFTRMLDNVVEINGLPLPSQVREITYKRRHGMGYLGLGSCLTMMGIPYGTEKSLEFTEGVTRDLAVEGWREALHLAKEKGAAPIMDDDFEVTQWMLDRRPEMVADGYKVGDVVKGRVLHAKYSRYMQQIAKVDPELVDELAKTGARFTHHSSIAPTGTISLSLANNASNGIEPSFAHHYSRNVIREGKKTKEKVDVFSYELLAYRHLVNPNAMPYAEEPENRLPDYFISADDISPKEHVDVQAAAQKWIDSSISKTANVPTDYPYEDFKDIYMYAYDKGLKGCTTFRFNPEAFQGVLVKESDLENTVYRFTLDDGNVVEAKGNEMIEYDGETHTAANLFDALKEGYYGKF